MSMGTSVNTERTYIPVAKPSILESDTTLMSEVLMSGWLTQGPRVKDFETAFRTFHSGQFAIATTSCTTALHLILDSLDLSGRDEVIAPSFTWIATVNSILYCGAKPVLVDSEPGGFNLDIDRVVESVTQNTRAIIAVDLFGQCVDIKSLRERIDPSICIIEDAACAIGASFNGNMAGTVCDAAAFSFHPRKTVTTGEGGMILTSNKVIANSCLKARNHGACIPEEDRHISTAPYLLPDFDVLGFNYRMTDLQAALGISQLQRLEAFVKRRRDIADYYNAEFRDIDLVRLPPGWDDTGHSWQSYVLSLNGELACVDARNQVLQGLHLMGIGARPGTHAVHQLKFYKDRLDIDLRELQEADKAANSTVAIPLHNELTDSEAEVVVASLKEVFKTLTRG